MITVKKPTEQQVKDNAAKMKAASAKLKERAKERAKEHAITAS